MAALNRFEEAQKRRAVEREGIWGQSKGANLDMCTFWAKKSKIKADMNHIWMIKVQMRTIKYIKASSIIVLKVTPGTISIVISKVTK